MKSFKKTFSPVGQFFKKASGDTNKFFKKGGQFQQGVKQVAGGFGSVGKAIGQGVNIGNNIVSAIEKSPYGAAFAPLTGLARSALGVGKMASNIGNTGKHVLKDVISGGNAGHITSNVLEKAKSLQRESNGIKFA